MKKLQFCLLLVICITASSCRIQPVVPSGVEDVKFSKIDMLKGIVNFDLGLKVNNPNSFAITVYGIDLKVSVAGVPMGSVAVTDKFKIEKNTEQVYPVKVNAELTELISSIPKLMSAISRHESNVELQGSIRVGSGIFRHTFPINIRQDKVKTVQLQQ